MYDELYVSGMYFLTPTVLYDRLWIPNIIFIVTRTNRFIKVTVFVVIPAIVINHL